MSNSLQLVDEFFRRINAHPDQVDMEAVSRSYISEMERGLSGEASSLPMIPTYLSVEGNPENDVSVIAIDAGGTNLRVGLVNFNNGKPVSGAMEKSHMPGSRGEVSKDEFFSEIADRILPLTAHSDIVGFCFSYPAEIFDSLDGRIILLTKEVRVRDSAGVAIGEALKEKLRERGVTKDLKFVILNDTAATLMGGIANLDISDSDGLLGLILGTGFNCCYAERGEKIGKISNKKDMVINCESGNFGGAPYGAADDLLDKNSDNPGIGRFEKMISGVYMGELISVTARLAAREGLLSADFAGEDIRFTTPEYDAFLRGDSNGIRALCTGSDAEILTAIIDTCFERASKLVCAVIAAICLHCDGGKTALHPFTVVAEGSMFHSSLLFRKKLDKHMAGHIRAGLGRFVDIRHAENATMSGTALAALIN